ncbi:MAG: hypothetical protein V3R56_09900 [Xanthomonadales bacterium]
MTVINSHRTEIWRTGESVRVLLEGDIAVFSESGSGWAQGTSRRQWLVLAQRRNTANDRFPARPKGAKADDPIRRYSP